MNGIESILEQVRLFAEQHVSSDVLNHAIPGAMVFLVAGVGLSVLGAKIARFGISGAFAVLGGYAGTFFAQETGYPAIICGLIGAMMLGVVGYHTMRLWVGVVASVVLASLALGLFGYQRVMPHMAEFDKTTTAAQAADSPSFALPSPAQQQAYRDRTPHQWAAELWSFAARKDTQLERNGKAIGLLAMATGLCLGVVAVRWALILSTSLVGTALVAAGATTLIANFFPGSYETLQQRPGIVGGGVGAFLFTSLVVQTMLTRKAPSGKGESSGKS